VDPIDGDVYDLSVAVKIHFSDTSRMRLRIERYRLVSVISSIASPHNMSCRLSSYRAAYSVKIQVNVLTVCQVRIGVDLKCHGKRDGVCSSIPNEDLNGMRGRLKRDFNTSGAIEQSPCTTA